MIWQAFRNVVQGASEVGTESFFVSVDFSIHSEQYANIMYGSFD